MGKRKNWEGEVERQKRHGPVRKTLPAQLQSEAGTLVCKGLSGPSTAVLDESREKKGKKENVVGSSVGKERMAQMGKKKGLRARDSAYLRQCGR